MIASSNPQASSTCSSSTGLATNEQNDETGSHDLSPSNDPSITTTTNHTANDEPIDDRTKYSEKRRFFYSPIEIFRFPVFFLSFPRHNILELIETEKEYVKDLALIVEVRAEQKEKSSINKKNEKKHKKQKVDRFFFASGLHACA